MSGSPRDSAETVSDRAATLEAAHWIGLDEDMIAGLEAAWPGRDDAELQLLARTREAFLDSGFITIAEGMAPLSSVWVYLSVVPELRERLRARGISDDAICSTLADVKIWLRHHYELRGCWGLIHPVWPARYFSGRLIALGRLQFEMGRFPQHCTPPEGLSADALVLDVHIPATGPLTDAECEESFRQAREFFPRHFPEHRAEAFVCVSWLMDRQLGEALPQTNIARFLQRFSPLEITGQGDFQIWERVFGGRVDVATAPRETALQRAVLDHVAKGGKWRTSAGYILI